MLFSYSPHTVWSLSGFPKQKYVWNTHFLLGEGCWGILFGNQWQLCGWCHMHSAQQLMEIYKQLWKWHEIAPRVDSLVSPTNISMFNVQSFTVKCSGLNYLELTKTATPPPLFLPLCVPLSILTSEKPASSSELSYSAESHWRNANCILYSCWLLTKAKTLLQSDLTIPMVMFGRKGLNPLCLLWH